jgi:DNA-binding MarR family transcriptional regulator
MSTTETKTRSEELVEAYTELGPAWGRWVNACLPSACVSFARMRLLSSLQHYGDQTMSELAISLDVTQRRITALVGALEEEELVGRRPNPADRRSTLVSITETGSEQQEHNWKLHQSEVALAFADLSEDRQQLLLEITAELTETLRRGAAGSPDVDAHCA